MTLNSYPVEQASTLPAKTCIRSAYTNIRQKHRPRHFACLSFQLPLDNSKVAENAKAASIALPHRAIVAAAAAAAAAALILGHTPLATAQVRSSF